MIPVTTASGQSPSGWAIPPGENRPIASISTSFMLVAPMSTPIACWLIATTRDRGVARLARAESSTAPAPDQGPVRVTAEGARQAKAWLAAGTRTQKPSEVKMGSPECQADPMTSRLRSGRMKYTLDYMAGREVKLRSSCRAEEDFHHRHLTPESSSFARPFHRLSRRTPRSGRQDVAKVCLKAWLTASFILAYSNTDVYTTRGMVDDGNGA